MRFPWFSVEHATTLDLEALLVPQQNPNSVLELPANDAHQRCPSSRLQKLTSSREEETTLRVEVDQCAPKKT